MLGGVSEGVETILNCLTVRHISQNLPPQLRGVTRGVPAVARIATDAVTYHLGKLTSHFLHIGRNCSSITCLPGVR